MSEEIKVGDLSEQAKSCLEVMLDQGFDTEETINAKFWIKIPKNLWNDSFVVPDRPAKEIINYWHYLNGKSPITQTEVEIKGGHMAGYGRINKFEYMPARAYGDKGDYLAETITYPDLGLVFCRHPDDNWERVEGLPHEQEDLKHLFEVKHD